MSPLPSIISYLESLARAESLSVNASIDARLKSSQAQRDIAWKAYITSQLGDLLVRSVNMSLSHLYLPIRQAHQLYVEHYWTFTRGALAKLMPVPQRWFVPSRLRQIHQPRLEAIGMWDAHYVEEPETSKPVTKTPQPPGVPPAQVYKKAFARERVCIYHLLLFCDPKLWIYVAIGESTHHLPAPHQPPIIAGLSPRR